MQNLTELDPRDARWEKLRAKVRTLMETADRGEYPECCDGACFHTVLFLMEKLEKEAS